MNWKAVVIGVVAASLIRADTLHAADVILNEYNAVGNGQFLEGDGRDTYWDQIEENGGDWFELAIVTDHLDMRGWQLVIHDELSDDITLTLTQHEIWSNLRSGTIVTVSQELANNVESYNPAVGQWWLNVKADDDAGGTFITASNFRVNNNSWQLTIEDAFGSVVFGPAGEGVNPTSGVSDQEVLKLEQDPSQSITPLSNYGDGQSSSFGSPNIWDGGAGLQDFSALRAVVPYNPLTAVRINEVLTHTDAPSEDWIELYNTTDSPVEVGGWYLSDDVRNLTMFQLPEDTVIPGGGYLIIRESELNFALSATRGDQVYLSETDAEGNMTGGRGFIEFGPAANGVSFGRHPDGTGTVYVLIEPTEGAPNADPLVGPVVINEIMYHPSDSADGDDGVNLEFIELKNTTGEPVDLHTHFADADETHPWRLADGVSFYFAMDTAIAACGYVLVVGFDPVGDPATLATFRNTYDIDEAIAVLGPFDGKLGNLGETVQLRRPDTPQEPGDPDEGLVPYLLVDEIPFTNRFPWPEEAAGRGSSLERIVPSAVGDVSTNWMASAATGGTPGAGNSTAQSDDCEPADTTQPPPDDDGASGRLCGSMGLINLALMVGGLMALRLCASSSKTKCARRLSKSGG
ncbi:MAG: lamin tail domain-containing protein [Phycisphaerales bacterium]|nr:MAG: lamin tail domain-containing protein [Phycisphaerales bacterium]